MKTRFFLRGLFVLLALILAQLACGALAPTEDQSSPTQPPAQAPTQAPSGGSGVDVDNAIRQWGSEAVASSEYGSDDWAAKQATGAPDTKECGDMHTAWAAASQDTKEWLDVFFATPVYASEINIYETYYPNQVAEVDLIDMAGEYIQIYVAPPEMVDDPCPFTLTVGADGKTLVQGVRIVVDQTVVGNWNEIDAVEIVGVPGVGEPVRPTVAP
ncbi:MAG: hypothetical protein H6636_14175 [Anaerolineales bacterium]|nr:hypothetical protein [Anaerolineales bacterium]